jgi:uncharacterized protein YceH (UPF0502 family)
MLGSVRLQADEARVLGSLMEKALTTPQQYPLTLGALVAACNQSSNRDPVVAYDDDTVRSALDVLKQQRLVRFVLPSSGRTAVRYRHIVDETLALDRRQIALVAVLVLRGPQTIGELRLRTDRMTEFDDLAQVERELGLLAALEEPLAGSLGRRPGQKEERWICPALTATPEGTRPAAGPGPGDFDGGRVDPGSDGPGGSDPDPVPDASGEDLAELRSALATLESEVSQIRRDLDTLRANLGE